MPERSPALEPREAVRRSEAPVDPQEKFRKNATIVAKGTTFSGKLKSDSNLFIEGDFDGELEAQATIFIADTAHVKADVRATDVVVAGSLTGTVNATNRFQAMPSAHVSGEIHSAILVVEPDSSINCRFAMNTREEYYR
jgi:cytoskeletal protein CcmA (bactofilin family)